MQVAIRTGLVAMSLIVIAVCAQSAPTTVDTAADEAALRAADDAFEHAFYSGDIETIVALYADDAVLLPSDAPAVRGREAIRKYFVSSVAGVKPGDAGTLSNRAVGVSGNLGWSSGAFKDTDAKGVTTGTGKFLSVSRKVNGKWVYIRDTWNNDPPAAPVR